MRSRHHLTIAVGLGGMLLLASTAPRFASTAPPVASPNENRRSAGALHEGTLHVSLVATRAMWHPEGDSLPGLDVAAFAEDGSRPSVPGPLLRVPRGVEIRATVRNDLTDTITLHFPPTTPAGPRDSTLIAPGETREVLYRATQPGNHLYRATINTALSRGLRIYQQLVGALIVDSTATPLPDRIFVLTIASDSLDPYGITPPELTTFAINGLSWPHTERLDATVGDSLRWRVLNANVDAHPMHLHGVYFRVDDVGLPPGVPRGSLPRWVVTERMLGFSTMSLVWVPEKPGNWLFHCHFQIHVAPPHTSHHAQANHALSGMRGLVLGIHVRPRPGERVVEHPRGRRQLRLVARQDAAFSDSAPSMRFVLQERGRATQDAGPGFSPTIELQRGEPVSITVVNELPEATAVHWHGIELDSYYDGVAGFGGIGRRLTPIIAPRDSFEARFTPPRAGTFIYHSHVDEPRQHRAGLLGALIVRDSTTADSSEERIFFIKSTRETMPFLAQMEINGQIDPDTTVLRVGRRYRFRLIHMGVLAPNMTVMFTARPDSVHETGPAIMPFRDSLLQRWRSVAKDGADLPVTERVLRDARYAMGMGETYDFEFIPAERGNLRLEFRVPIRQGRIAARVPIRVE
jgi:manganese oxidase